MITSSIYLDSLNIPLISTAPHSLLLPLFTLSPKYPILTIVFFQISQTTSIIWRGFPQCLNREIELTASLFWRQKHACIQRMYRWLNVLFCPGCPFNYKFSLWNINVGFQKYSVQISLSALSKLGIFFWFFANVYRLVWVKSLRTTFIMPLWPDCSATGSERTEQNFHYTDCITRVLFEMTAKPGVWDVACPIRMAVLEIPTVHEE